MISATENSKAGRGLWHGSEWLGEDPWRRHLRMDLKEMRKQAMGLYVGGASQTRNSKCKGLSENAKQAA